MAKTKNLVLCLCSFGCFFVGLMMALLLFLVLPVYFTGQDIRRDICHCADPWFYKMYDEGKVKADETEQIRNKHTKDSDQVYEGARNEQLQSHRPRSNKLGFDEVKFSKDGLNKEDLNKEEIHLKIGKIDKLQEQVDYCIPLPRLEVVLEEEETSNRIEDYPHVVSISTLAYSDDRRDKRFLGTGTIVSNLWILTASDCLSKVDQLDQLEVRSSSPHWSKGGIKHSVIQRTDSPFGIAALKISPGFRFNRFMKKLEVLLRDKTFKFSTALSLGWDKPRDEVTFQSKETTFSVVKWSTNPCEEGVCNNAEIVSSQQSIPLNNVSKDEAFGSFPKMKCDGFGTGKPLIPDCSILAGIQTGVSCGKEDKERFVNLQTEAVQRWLHSILASEAHRKYILPQQNDSISLFSQLADDLYLESCSVEMLDNTEGVDARNVSSTVSLSL